MFLVKLLITSIPFIFVALYIYLKKWYIPITSKIMKAIFLGVLSTIITLLLTIIVYMVYPNLANTISKNGVELFIIIFISVALIEEFSKWIVIKLMKIEHNTDFIIFSLLVSLIFTIIENIGYYNKYNLMYCLMRNLVPGHLVFQLIMGYLLLVSSKYKKKNKRGMSIFYLILSILIPTFIHSIQDYILWNVNSIITIEFIYVSLIDYLIIIFGIKYINKEEKN